MRTRCASSAPERGGRGCWGRGEGAPGPGAVSRGAPELDEGAVSPGAPESSPAPAPGSSEGSVLPQDTGVLKGSGSGSAPPVLAGWPESESESAGLSESGSGWEGLLANYVRSSFRAGFLSSLAGSTAHLIQKTSTLAILWFGARMVMEGEFTVGQLIAFQMLSGRVTEPILRLATLWQDFQQVRLSIERLGDVLNFPAEPDSSPGRSSLGRIKGRIEFNQTTIGRAHV